MKHITADNGGHAWKLPLEFLFVLDDAMAISSIKHRFHKSCSCKLDKRSHCSAQQGDRHENKTNNVACFLNSLSLPSPIKRGGKRGKLTNDESSLILTL